jgi:hypothetical protein
MTKAQRQHGMTVNFGILYGKKEAPVSDNQRKYNLTITEEQAGILADALDLFARIGIGQFEEVLQVYDPAAKLADIVRDTIRLGLNDAKMAAGHHANASHGIHNSKVPDRFRAAFDMKQVITNRVAWDRNPKGGIQVQFDEPSRTSELTQLATITEVK